MLARVTELLVRRVILAVTELPTVRTSLQVVSILVLVAVACVTIGLKRRFLIRLRLPLTLKHVLMYGLLPLVAPSLFEEIVYRVLLLPRSDEHMPPLAQIASVAFSLTVFVVAHPLRYYVMPSKRSLTFINSTFLILATILGSGCTAAFLVSDSIWPPLLVHYACVVGWLFFLGGAERLNG